MSRAFPEPRYGRDSRLQETPAKGRTLQECQSELAQALADVQHGEVSLVVHKGRIVEINQLKRLRF